MKTEHVNEVNRAIQNGDVQPKWKGADLVVRVAVKISTINQLSLHWLQMKHLVIHQRTFHNRVLTHLYIKPNTCKHTNVCRLCERNYIAINWQAKDSAKHSRHQGGHSPFPWSCSHLSQPSKSIHHSDYEVCRNRSASNAYKPSPNIRQETSSNNHSTQSMPHATPFIQKISKPLNNLITPNIQNVLVSAGHFKQEDD